MPSEIQIKRAKEKHSLEFLGKSMVIGVGIGNKITNNIDTRETCVRVYVVEKLPLQRLPKDHRIPAEINGIKTDVIKIEEIEKLDTINIPPARCKRLRPAPGGCSISHYAVNGRGTLGCWVKDKKNKTLLLSCWHVIANKGMCHKGDPILQPGRLDGGKLPDDVIAYLERWKDVTILGPTMQSCKERIQMALEHQIKLPINLIDAALAEPISEEVVSNEILGLGKMRGTSEAKRGRVVIKSGASTGVTGGIVEDVNFDVLVKYRGLGMALFKDQIFTKGNTIWNPITHIISWGKINLIY